MRTADLGRSLQRALTRERARVALTIAGIGVGTFAVAMLVSLGAAIKDAIAGSLHSLGENLIIVTHEVARSSLTPAAAAWAGGQSSLGEQDAAALRSLSTVERASSVLTAPCSASFAAQSVHTTCVGVDAEYLDVAHILLAEGAEFGPDTENAPRAVAIVGATVARRLFATQSPAGQMLQLAGGRVRVCGVARARGSGVGGVDEDDFVLVPKTYARQRLAARSSPTDVDALFVLARGGRGAGGRPAAGAPTDGMTPMIADTINDIRATLARRRHVDSIDDRFSIASLSGLMATSVRASDLLTLLMAGMAALSVLVGGVGIVNVMLTRVAERRLEIGLKLALGASPRVIAFEFLLEAILLAGLGAIAGLVAAEVLGTLLSWAHAIDAGLTLPAVALSAGLAFIVGIAAGVWPAQRAAHLHPREILRDA